MEYSSRKSFGRSSDKAEDHCLYLYDISDNNKNIRSSAKYKQTALRQLAKLDLGYTLNKVKRSGLHYSNTVLSDKIYTGFLVL